MRILINGGNCIDYCRNFECSTCWNLSRFEVKDEYETFKIIKLVISDDGTRSVEPGATDPTLDSSRTGSTGTKN